MNKNLWILSCFLIISGLLLLAAGMIERYIQSRKDMHWGKSKAKVVELILQEPDRKHRQDLYKNYYYPVIEYYANGKLYKTIHPHGSYPSSYRVGQELRILFEKADPENYEIYSITRRQIMSELLYAAGVLALAVGSIIFLIFAARG